MTAMQGADLTTHTYLQDHSFVVEAREAVQVLVPEIPLGPHSLIVATEEPKSFMDWNKHEISRSFEMLQKIVRIWNEQGNPDLEKTDSYLVYGCQNLENLTPSGFQWEIIPYYSSALLSKVYTFFQNSRVYAGIVFEDSPIGDEQLIAAQEFYQEHFQDMPLKPVQSAENTKAVSDDLFCDPVEIDKRLVLRGKHINVLFHNRLTRFAEGGIHFLLVPKSHRRTFAELSLEEYQEAIRISQLLIPHFFLQQEIQEVTLIHKNGIDAGQTIPHWHMDLMLSLSTLSKFHIFKSLPEEMTVMNEGELELTVREYIHQFIRDPELERYLPF